MSEGYKNALTGGFTLFITLFVVIFYVLFFEFSKKSNTCSELDETSLYIKNYILISVMAVIFIIALFIAAYFKYNSMFMFIILALGIFSGINGYLLCIDIKSLENTNKPDTSSTTLEILLYTHISFNMLFYLINFILFFMYCGDYDGSR